MYHMELALIMSLRVKHDHARFISYFIICCFNIYLRGAKIGKIFEYTNSNRVKNLIVCF